MFTRVLLCYDGSLESRRALKRGAELALREGAQIYVLSIVPENLLTARATASAAGHSCSVDVEQDYRQALDESIEWLKMRGAAAQGFLARGDTIEQITAYAKKVSADLIVLGHYPHPSGSRWWSGQPRVSLAEKVNCCILIAVDLPDVAPASPRS
jgi:nucleotide-binding universal stress UspA family protein